MNEIVVLKALLMGVDVQMRGLNVCIAGEGLSLIGEEGDILPFEIPFSTFLAWCNEMPEEDIAILQMNIVLNEEKQKKDRSKKKCKNNSLKKLLKQIKEHKQKNKENAEKLLQRRKP